MVAKALAEEFWESHRSERFRKFWSDKKQFIGRNWPTFVEPARSTLAMQLGDPKLPEPMKEAIMKALIEDRERSLRQSSAKVGRGPFTLNPEHPGPREKRIFYDGK